ncbi:MAG: META domain-containing protein [Burkholderiales bacterium]
MSATRSWSRQPTALQSWTVELYITSKVMANMVGNPDVNQYYVKVVTENSVVYLMGLVTRREGKRPPKSRYEHERCQAGGEGLRVHGMSRLFAAAGAGLAVLIVSVGAFAASPWRVAGHSSTGRRSALRQAHPVTLEIQGDGVAASAGCNRAAGGFQERGETRDQSAGRDDDGVPRPQSPKIEARYFGLLESRPSWQIKGDRLTLTGTGAALTFKRAPGQ